MNQYKKAFTLIELIVVIGIIGLLASIILVFLSSAKNRGNDTAKINSFSEVRKALQMYASDHVGFPDSTTTLAAKGYIQTMDPHILYSGTDSNGNICYTESCPSYHLAIPLDDPTNLVLKSDSNSKVGNIDGTTKNCLPGGGLPNSCYDIVP